jgi:hypothetical protein
LRDEEPVSSIGDSRLLDLSTGHVVHARSTDLPGKNNLLAFDSPGLSMRSPIERGGWLALGGP